MQRIVLGLITAIAIVAMPSYLAAGEGKRPQGPRPDMHRKGPTPDSIFKRLDANRDGVVKPNELPADMPEHFRMMLAKADKDKNGVLTAGELKQSMKHRPGPKAKAPKGPRGKNVKSCPVKKGCPVQKGMKKESPCKKGKAHPKKFNAEAHKKFAKAIFARLDKDHDGMLRFGEFYVGFCQVGKAMAHHAQNWKMGHGKKDFAKGHMPYGKKQFAKKPMPYGKKQFAKKPMPYGKKQFAKHHQFQGKNKFAGCPYCFHCMKAKMGPMGHHGPNMQFGMKPGMQGPKEVHYHLHIEMQPGQPFPPMPMMFGQGQKGPWQHGMQFGMNPGQKPMMKPAFGHGQPGKKQYAAKPRKPHGEKKGWQKGECPWMKKPGNKGPKHAPRRPAVRKPKVKVETDKKIIEIEARLTAVERQQEAILVAIQEQHATMMAALQKTNKLVSAKLASLGRHEAKARPQWSKTVSEKQHKEMAKKPEHRRPHHDRDRD